MTRRYLSAAAAVLSGLALAACDNSSSEAPVELGKDYYPLKVGAERVYNVVDKTYNNNQVTSTTTGQIREQLTETYPDAAGVLTYKLVRSSRATAADAWRVDSAQTITVNERNLLLTRSNWRTVELIFPVRTGATWNRNAFNDRNQLTQAYRRYQDVGASFTAGSRSYDNTITVYDDNPEVNNVFYEFTIRQVYAKGIGPVFREQLTLRYCDGTGAPCPVAVKYITTGKTHTETLVQ